ncbi:MAG: RNA polymerase factor sigma-54 [Polyangia bacterium]|nr:RNA polymerase factor sigma-54 [Polyangia bacterium]
MALEFRQQLRLTQQLVMTPQLQQAIKLLQLSRLELVDLVREEMLENPVLEDASDQPSDPPSEEAGDNHPDDLQNAPAEIEASSPTEVKGDERAVSEIDWEAYLESYTMSPALPSMHEQEEEYRGQDQTLSNGSSLASHLMWQLKLGGYAEEEEAIGTLIIGNLDAAGYLREPSLEDLAEQAGVSQDLAEAVLHRIQTFDPIGVAARDLSECLLVQARHIGADDDVLVAMITRHLHNLENKNYQAIAKDLKQPIEEIYEAAKVIQSLDPKPGRQYSNEEIRYITPDVYVHRLGDSFFVVPNDDGLPRLRVSSFYKNALASGGAEAKEYVQSKLRSAQWLIRSIQQRQRTIIRVTESIVRYQEEFFRKGIGYLRPMTLAKVAEDIGMHESTISRVTTNKWVSTPQGIFELKYFFNSAITRSNGDDIASESVKNKIRELVAQEDSRKPLSDQNLTKMLQDQGIEIARRTVAKYREQLGILSSSKRKQVF